MCAHCFGGGFSVFVTSRHPFDLICTTNRPKGINSARIETVRVSKFCAGKRHATNAGVYTVVVITLFHFLLYEWEVGVFDLLECIIFVNFVYIKRHATVHKETQVVGGGLVEWAFFVWLNLTRIQTVRLAIMYRSTDVRGFSKSDSCRTMIYRNKKECSTHTPSPMDNLRNNYLELSSTTRNQSEKKMIRPTAISKTGTTSLLNCATMFCTMTISYLYVISILSL